MQIQFCLKSFSKIVEKLSRRINISILSSTRKNNSLVENYTHVSFVTNIEFLIIYSIYYKSSVHFLQENEMNNL